MTQLFLAFARTGLSTGALVLFFALLTPLMRKKYTAGLRRAVWLLLAVRLLLPFSLFPAFLFPGKEAPVQIELPAAVAETVAPLRHPGGETALDLGQPLSEGDHALPAGGAHPENADAAAAGQPGAVPPPDSPQAENSGALPALLPQKPASPVPAPLSPLGIAALVWVCGMLLFLLDQLLRYALWRRQLRRWDLPLSPKLEQAVDRAAQVVRLRRLPPAFGNDRIHTPMLTGLLRPVLLVPPQLAEDPGLPLMLRHELTHALHRDLFWKGLLLAVRALHWYHPAVWLLCREAEQDIEYACDEAVLRRSSPLTRAAYGGALLAVAGMNARVPALTTHFSAGGRSMKRRLEALFSQQGKRRGGALFLCAALLTGLLGGMVGCGVKEETAPLSSSASSLSDLSLSAPTDAEPSFSYYASTEQGLFQTIPLRDQTNAPLNQLIYSDFSSGTTGPLCPDPDCDHLHAGCPALFPATDMLLMGVVADRLVLAYSSQWPQDPSLLSDCEFPPYTLCVETMALDGSDRRPLVTLRPVEAEPETGYAATHLYFPYTFSDGSFLYLCASPSFAQPGDALFTLLRVSLSTGETEPLQDVFEPCLGAYSGHLLFGGIDWQRGELRLEAVPLEGGMRRQVYCDYYGQDSGYFRDGSTLYLTNSALGTLKKFDLLTGEETLITDQLPPLPDRASQRCYLPTQVIDQKLLFSVSFDDSSSLSLNIKRWAVDLETGKVSEFVFLPPEQSHMEPFWHQTIFAATADALCYSVPEESVFSSHLVLADKASFWAGEPHLRYLANAPGK